MVSRDSVCISLLLVELISIDILIAYIQFVYLNAPCKEKVLFRDGSEFGLRKIFIVGIYRSLYGMKILCDTW